MSNDVILAQQFWAWPDPVIKRDANGCILFINAAFLQMYGGTVEAWTGNVVQGWSTPQPPAHGMAPTPHRFETRTPSPDGSAAEQVYDWLEQTDMNGAALAIARNVTVFMSAPQTMTPPPAQPAEHSQVSESMTAENGPAQNVDHVNTSHSTEAPVQNIEPNAQYEETVAPPVDDYHNTADVSHAPHTQIADTQIVDTQIVHTEAPQYTQEEPLNASIETPPNVQQPNVHQEAAPQNYDETAQVAPQPPAQPSVQAPFQASAQATHIQPEAVPNASAEERDFQRRTLPMESNNSILGNNWRDAVIAKAVGAESDVEDISVPQEQSNSDEGNGVKPIHILLAEDNAINALLTRTLLEAEGHTVETVEDGALAVEAMKSQSYDLIFMDMRMPNMDGLEATRKIRQIPDVPDNLPIIALTANAFDDDRNACFDSGMNDFMTKPVSAEELSEMVANWTNTSDSARNAA